MIRNNGFLNLNDYYRKIKKKNNWHNYDFLMNGIIEPSLYSDSHYWLKLEGKKYYFKPTNYPYHEILGYHIAKYLGFNVCFYDLAELKNSEHENVKGVISESYRIKNAKYIPGNEVLKEYFEKEETIVKAMGLTDEWQEYYEGPYFMQMNNLEIIWQALEYRYRNRNDVSIKDLLDDIINQYIFSILTRAHDRGSQNWEIEESAEGVKVCPIYDSEITFYDEENTVALSTSFVDNDASVKDSVKRFLSISSSEYIELFLDKHNSFQLDDLTYLIEKVEKQIKAEIPAEIKEEIINNFLLNQIEINEALEELNISKGR